VCSSKLEHAPGGGPSKNQDRFGRFIPKFHSVTCWPRAESGHVAQTSASAHRSRPEHQQMSKVHPQSARRAGYSGIRNFVNARMERQRRQCRRDLSPRGYRA